MEISKNFSSLFSNEVATSVPIVYEVSTELRQSTGIGDKPMALIQTTKDTEINLSKTIPSDAPTQEEMEKMSFLDLKTLRDKYSGDKFTQNYIAPFEHRAMNREIVQEGSALDKLLNTAALSLATPAYAIGKAASILPEDVDTSTQYLEEVKQGFIGIGEGLQALFSDGKSEIKREVSPEVQRMQSIRGQVEQIIGDLIKTESGGKHTTEEGTLITSPTGAKGITQVLPSTAKKPGYGIKPLQNDSVEEYIRFGKEYLAKMIDIFDNAEQGIAAYNAGPGAVHRAISKANRTGRDWKEFLPKEAKEYIKKVKYNPQTEPTFHKPNITDIMGTRG